MSTVYTRLNVCVIKTLPFLSKQNPQIITRFAIQNKIQPPSPPKLEGQWKKIDKDEVQL